MTVTNVAPQITAVTLDQTAIDEGGTVTVNGTFTDAGILDTHTVQVDWGDGTSATSSTVDQAAGTFTAVHTYADDDPSGTSSDPYAINVTLSDDDGGTDTAPTTVIVSNVDPQITALTLDHTTIDEGGAVTLSGTFTDPGTLDTHTVLVDWGDGTLPTSLLVAPADRTFTAVHPYPDDNATDTYTIGVTLSDDDGGTDNAPTTVTVINLDPQISESNGSTDVREDGSITDKYEVVLVSPPTADVQIAITPDIQVRVTSATPLTFTPDNWSVPQEVSVEAVDDDEDESTAPATHSGTITHTISSADELYDGIDIADVTVNITDNDTAGITVSPISGPTTEPDGTATFTVVLDSEPAADVTIGLSSSDTTEGTVPPASLLFEPDNWDTSKTVTVTGVNDELDDGDISYTISIATVSSDDPKYDGLVPVYPSVSVTNQDDEIQSLVVLPLSLPVPEGDEAEFTVKLGVEPISDVTVNITKQPGGDPDLNVSGPSTLTFTTENWDDLQEVPISAAQDAGTTHGTASFTISSIGVPSHTVTATEADNDAPLIIDDGDAGHTLQGAWNAGQVADVYNGDYLYRPKGSGLYASTWTFTGLASGNYDVFASWADHRNRATDAPFTISSGSQSITTLENQEVNPDDEQEPLSGVWFEHLTEIAVYGNTLAVTLTDDANEYVTADAVWVRSAGDPVDFGDAPDGSYPTLLASNGARHVVVPEFHLGGLIDFEADGQPNATATGDDAADLIDEDGVVLTSQLFPGQVATFDVTVTDPGGIGGFLDAWIDADRDGNFETVADEHFIQIAPVTHGLNQFDLLVPAEAKLGETYARFRLSSTGSPTPTGLAPDGEVEDYAVTVSALADLGSTTFLELSGQDPSTGSLWYRFETTRAGLLTLDAVSENSGQTVALTLYDQSRQDPPLAESNLVDGRQRIDWTVAGPGEVYYARLSGTSTEVTFRLANLVHQAGDTLTVFGTDDVDAFELDTTTGRRMRINGIGYEFTDAEAAVISFDGAGGNDTAVLTGSTAAETARLRPGQGTFSRPGLVVSLANTPYIAANGGGGNDVAFLYDSPGDDTLVVNDTYGTLTGGLPGDPFGLTVNSFRYVHGYSTAGGTDTANLHGTAGQETVVTRPTDAKIIGVGYFGRAWYFDEVTMHGGGGTDVAYLYDSPGDDTLVVNDTYGSLTGGLPGNLFAVRANNFRYVHGYSTAGGTDTADLHGTAGKETVVARPTNAKIIGSEHFGRAWYFDEVTAEGGGGIDVAFLYDSPGDDTLEIDDKHGSLAGGLPGDPFEITVNNFRYVHGYATAGGADTAKLHGTAGQETVVARPTNAKIIGSEHFGRAWYFDEVTMHGGGGIDVAFLYDSPGDDTLEIDDTHGSLAGGLPGDPFEITVNNFRYVHGYATAGGTDTAKLYGTAGKETVVTRPTYVKIIGAGYFGRAWYFDHVFVEDGGGDDDGVVYDADHLESGFRPLPPSGLGKYYWLWELEHYTVVNQSGTTHFDAVDAVYTAYWD